MNIVKNGRTKSGDQEYYCRKCKSYFTSGSNPDYHRSRFDAETMCLTVLWYFRFNLSLRNLAEIMLSHGIDVSHQTIARWIKKIGRKIIKKAATRFFKKTLKSMGVKPERIYTDKNNAYPGANDDILKAKHGIKHIAITPIERSHVPVKRRYHAMTGFMKFNNAYLFTENFEYILGYLGGTNASNRQTRFEAWNKVQSLVDKKAS
jgi:transposase-like protein